MDKINVTAYKINVTASGDGKNRDKLTRNSDYVALLTENFHKNDKCLGEMRDAKAMNIPMYAIVKHGDIIPKWILQMPWRKMIYFNGEDDMQIVAKILIKEIQEGKR